MPDYQFTRFPIPGKEVDFEAIQEAITALQTQASALQEQLDALTESAVPNTREINGYDLSEDRILFAQDIPSKNLLPNTASTQTINGVTFTVNDDGSITANGTASSDANFTIIAPATGALNFLPSGSYVVSGCPSGGSTSTYSIQLENAGQWKGDYGNGETFERSTTTGEDRVRIHIGGGTTVNNLVFRPMIRLASVEDDTYVPYAKTNVELTKVISDQEWETVFATGSSTTCTLANFTASKYAFNWCSFYANRTKTSFRFLCRVRFDGVQRTGGSPSFTIQTNCYPSEAYSGYGGLRSAGGTTVTNASWGVDTICWTIYPNGQLTVYMTETYTNIVNGNALYVIVFPVPSL